MPRMTFQAVNTDDFWYLEILIRNRGGFVMLSELSFYWFIDRCVWSFGDRNKLKITNSND